MAISRQALDQVRSILRELDQRIDSAREQRTSDRDGDEAERSAPTPSNGARQAEPERSPPTPGRARPKRPSF